MIKLVHFTFKVDNELLLKFLSYFLNFEIKLFGNLKW